MKTKALYAGSFDPFTDGHYNIVRQALRKYGSLIIAVGINEAKKESLFSSLERALLIQDALQNLMPEEVDKISIDTYEGLTVDYAMQKGVNVLIRGVRNPVDLAAEESLAQTNSLLASVRGFSLETDLILSEATSLQAVSSSVVRGLCREGEYILAQKYVAPNIHQAMMEKCLKKVFLDLAPLNPASEEAFSVRHLWLSLVSAYKKRAYHNLSHLAFMLNMLKVFLRHEKCDGLNKDIVIWSIFMHDYYQDIEQSDNEEKVCDFCEENQLPIKEKGLLRSCIMATKHNAPGQTLEEKLIADLDLAILGCSDKELYEAYVTGVRKEYEAYDDETYCQGRRSLLESFLQRDCIYQTEFFRKRFEKQARKNILQEIESLR